jgi:hypothetical protein
MNRKLPNGLICLKGGDLGNEISESGLRPTYDCNRRYIQRRIL